MQAFLPDPRAYPTLDLNHPVIRELDNWLSEHSAAATIRLHSVLENLLAQRQDETLAGVKQALPSAEYHRALVANLDELLTPRAGGAQVRLFAIPIVCILGSEVLQNVPTTLPNLLSLQTLLVDQGVIAPGHQVWLASNLVDHATLQGVAANRWYQAAWHLPDVARGLPIDLSAADIPVDGTEQATLRYIFGASWEGDGVARLLAQPATTWGLALSQWLQSSLAQPNLTVFAIPRSPQGVFGALQIGRYTLLDVSFQLFASRIIKTIRHERAEPTAVLAAHEGGEIRVTIESQTDATRRACFVWPLAASDEVSEVAAMMLGWLRESQLSVVHVLSTIQADCGADGLPFFADVNDIVEAH